MWSMLELTRNADSVRTQIPSTDNFKTSGFPPIEQSQNTEILCKKNGDSHPALYNTPVSQPPFTP